MLFLSRLLLLAISVYVASAADYVGGNTCKRCHPDMWASFYKNAHFRSVALDNQPPDRTGCEGCHGPGSEHIKQPQKANIRAFSLMGPGQVLDNCLTCHSQDVNRAFVRRSPHTLADVACTSCHAIHRATTPKLLLAKSQPELCYGCHADVRAQFNLPFKHRVNEGAMVCSDCHNPHGTPAPTWRMGHRPRMVSQALGNEESCLRCHTDLRGPFVFEHAAVRVDGCESCHLPHGGANPRLLRRPVVFTLCLECHNGAGTFGRQGDGVAQTPPSHNMASPRFQNCTSCHVRIHGSNAHAQFLR